MTDAKTQLVGLYNGRNNSIATALGKHYRVINAESVEQLMALSVEGAKLLVLDLSEASGQDGLEIIAQIKAAELDEIPIIAIHGKVLAGSKIKAFELGVDDFISSDAEPSEIAVRCEKLIFSKIANDQLREQIKYANEMAFIAMSDTSDLGVNIQFMLDANTCNNLDELGMRFLQAINSYGLRASIQLRGEFETKNMEGNGMVKEMEAALLWELKDGGRYVDFKQRSVMNYEQVSVLVKNMPLDDPKKYGAIKDNVFSLLQGADARIKALDNVKRIREEQKLISALTVRMQSVMADVDEGYQVVMKDIADVVEEMADKIQGVIEFLGLHEDQERALEKIMEYGISQTNGIFSKGIQLDSQFKNLVAELGMLFSADGGRITPAQRAKLMALLQGN
ncbi:MAG: hypothetical protein H7A08_09740 [Oceanospirillaceae bacterium]|nr:hypothetical protein [Oceanospirillaceae bacterium]